MQYYQTKTGRTPGTDFREIYAKAYSFFKILKNKTKRKPHIRSVYFNKQKIFLDFFWEHMHNKNPRDRLRRLKYFSAAIELIQKTKIQPESSRNPNKKSEILHRFRGRTQDGYYFTVQIKELSKTSQKYLISLFPE